MNTQLIALVVGKVRRSIVPALLAGSALSATLGTASVASADERVVFTAPAAELIVTPPRAVVEEVVVAPQRPIVEKVVVAQPRPRVEEVIVTPQRRIVEKVVVAPSRPVVEEVVFGRPRFVERVGQRPAIAPCYYGPVGNLRIRERI